MDIDTTQLTTDILAALRGEITSGWGKIRAFSEKQAKALATQAAFITRSRVAGALKDDDSLFKFFTDQLKEMAANFARAVAAMTIVTLEKAWNAIVGVVWGAVNDVLTSAGFGRLSVPRAPRT
jgi:roadblock/LC7 domain-containing protein